MSRMFWRKQFTLRVHCDAYPRLRWNISSKGREQTSDVWTMSVFALFILILVLLLSLAMQHDFTRSRDMHQFISAGKLLVDKGLMPYKDYPFHHFPNIVFVYALLFMFTSHLTLVANLFSVTCSFIMLSVLFKFIYDLLPPKEQAFTGLMLAVSSIITLATNDLFVFTTGWSWNDELELYWLFLLLFLIITPLRAYERPVGLCSLVSYWDLRRVLALLLAFSCRLLLAHSFTWRIATSVRNWLV